MGDDGGQLDLFSISAIDPPWRDNRDAMGYPFLALQKRRTTSIEFAQNGVSVGVYAHPTFSLATIWDWDVMIFAASHINEAIESRRQISPRITFVPHDCLKQIGRGRSARDYQRLADAIRRLHATTVITNIREVDQPDRGGESGFHWLTGYWIPKRYRRYRTAPSGITYITPHDPEGEADSGRPWEIELPPWIYNAIVRQGDILAVHPDYFQLSGGLERWLYRLARKAVPDKAEPPAIRFKMETLHARSGVTRDLKLFAFDVRKLAETQPLPEYGIQIEYRKGRRELVTLYRDKAKPCRPPRGRRLKTIRGDHIEPAVEIDAYLEDESVFTIAPTTASAAIAADVVDLPGEMPAPAAVSAPAAITDDPVSAHPDLPHQKETARALELACQRLATAQARFPSTDAPPWDELMGKLHEAQNETGRLLDMVRRIIEAQTSR